jgi:hypothetical protein
MASTFEASFIGSHVIRRFSVVGGETSDACGCFDGGYCKLWDTLEIANLFWLVARTRN